MSKTDVCAGCGKRPISQGRSRVSLVARALGLCYTCYRNSTTRKKRQKAIGWKPRRRGPPKTAAHRPKKGPRQSHHRSGGLDQAFDGIAAAFDELGSVVEDELLESVSHLGDDITGLVASVRAAIARTFQQRKAMAELMTRLKKKANEAAADLRRRIKELEGSRRELGREISRLPTPEADAHAHGEETTT